jgi:hypothetical protein
MAATNVQAFSGDVTIHEYIYHTGDDNTYFGFSGADTFKIATAGVDHLTINSSGTVILGVNMVIPDYIYHAGEAGYNTYFGFSGDDTIVMRTSGVDRLTVNSAGNVSIGVNMYLPNYIYHTGDDNTYFGFSAADTIVMRTAGVDRLTVGSTGNVTLSSTASIRQNNTSTWTGDPGSGVGKIEYHSNRWYIVAGSNSTELLKVRRDGSDKFCIDNNGSITLGTVPAARISGTVSSATTAGTCTGNSATATAAVNADTVDGQHAHEMSWGHDTAHGTYSNFNTFLNTDKFGAHFTTGTTNGPGQSGPTQYYHQRMALGSGHNNYSLQLAIGRGRTDNYLWYRNEEANTPTTWYKMRAGYADSAGTAGTCTGNSATATTAGTCSGNSATASSATTLTTQATINRVKPYSNSYGAGYNQAALEIREYNLEGATGGTEWSRAPRIGMHWGSRVASQLLLESSGAISCVNNPGTAYEHFKCAALTCAAVTCAALTSSGIITCNANKIAITGNSPTLYLRDSDHRTGQIHMSDNRMYFLSGTANSDSWTQVNGQWPFYLQTDTNGAVFGGSIVAAGNVTAYSDIRRKKDLVKIDNALGKVEQLTGYTYTSKIDNKRYTGLIAQDVEKVLPEAVNKETDGHLSLAYGNMVGLLVEAVKELTHKNEILEARLNAIECP